MTSGELKVVLFPNSTLSFPECAFFVLIITTPLAERLPYKVEAAAVLKTEMLFISSGEKAAIPSPVCQLEVFTLKDCSGSNRGKGTPSKVKSTLLDFNMER